jgi:hypothetical protein
VYVRYLSTTLQSITVPNNSITYAKLDSNLQADIQGRNRIINGSMVVDQRNAGASVTPATTYQYTLDRWEFTVTQSSKLTTQRNAGSVTPPVGFSNYLGVTSSSSYSINSTDRFNISQYIEGFNVADLNWGSANAKSVTLSFWVYSSLTGTFGGSVVAQSGSPQYYPFSYTIPTANTWTQIIVTVTGNTSVAINTTTSAGIILQFGLGVGSTYSGTAGAWSSTEYRSATGATSVVGTSGATFYITGVQLEEGTTATSFEREIYSETFAKCQRYFQKIPLSFGSPIDPTLLVVGYQYPVVMRAAPTAALLTTTPYAEVPYVAGFTASGATLQSHTYVGACDIKVAGFSGLTNYRSPMWLDNNQASLSAEL